MFKAITTNSAFFQITIGYHYYKQEVRFIIHLVIKFTFFWVHFSAHCALSANINYK